jgi:hypothetical protein
MMNPNEKKVILFMLSLLLTLGLLCVFQNELFFIIIREDHIVESATAILYLLSAGIFFILFRDTRKIMHLTFGVLLLIFCLEELSYGQRILGYETPSFMSKINVQDEMNIHNTKFFHSEILLHLFWLAYFLFLPLIRSPRLEHFCDRTGFLIPSRYFSPFMGVVFPLLWIDLKLGKINIEEISELIISFLFFFTAFFAYLRLRGGDKDTRIKNT